MVSRNLTFQSPIIGWILIIVGLVAVGAAWRARHPGTTADFTLFYVSAQHTDAKMFARPPGPPRGNMNPPIFQLLMRPLTNLSLPAAATTFRVLNIVALLGCIWWLAQTSDERWTLADYGALLAWAPMASMITLNQLTWILWPLLLWAWWCWRHDRWAAGAVGYGLALSLKPFLGVILLWLLVTRRWRAAGVALATAAASFAIGVAAFGIGVTRAWLQALGDVTWTHAIMNASLQGILARTLSDAPFSSSPPLVVVLPAVVAALALGGSALIVAVTLLRTRHQSVDESWLPLMSSALLASPLGWLYYIWWILPGNRPSRLLIESPLLWIPMLVTIAIQPSGWRTVTLSSIYFWGLFTLWLRRSLPSYRTNQ